jgi:ATP-dependent protease ClpP protease subunit
MSSLILQAANKRVLMPHSYFMFHEGTLAYEGTYKTVMSSAEFDRKGRQQMIDIYVQALQRDGKFKGKSKAQISKWVNARMEKKEDVFIQAKDAVEIGFADEVFDYNWKNLTKYTDEQMRRG